MAANSPESSEWRRSPTRWTLGGFSPLSAWPCPCFISFSSECSRNVLREWWIADVRHSTAQRILLFPWHPHFTPRVSSCSIYIYRYNFGEVREEKNNRIFVQAAVSGMSGCCDDPAECSLMCIRRSFFVAFSFLCHFFILVFGNYWVGWMPPIYRVHLFHFSVVSTCHFLSGCNYGIVVCLPLPTSSREHIGIFSYFPLHCWATTTCQHKNKGGWCRIVDKDSTLT